MQHPEKAKGRRVLGGTATSQKTKLSKKGSNMNIQEPPQKGNDQLRTHIDVLLDTVQVMISSATPYLGAGDRYAVISKKKMLDTLRAMDALTLEVYA